MAKSIKAVIRIFISTLVLYALMSACSLGGLPQDDSLEMNSEQLIRVIQALEEEVLSLRGRNLRLRRALGRLPGDEFYIVIDTHDNKLLLKRGNQIIREAVCSTGSGKTLVGPKGRKWVFETPKGTFEVLKKEVAPIWVKPVWAFVEKGEPVPILPEDFNRFEYGALGEYALSIGDGYKIHGTLYEKLLGRSITHGCIRLGSEDLGVVFNMSEIGTKVYIY